MESSMPVEELSTIVLDAERGLVNQYIRPSNTHASIETWVELFLTAILRYTPFFLACASYDSFFFPIQLFKRVLCIYLSNSAYLYARAYIILQR